MTEDTSETPNSSSLLYVIQPRRVNDSYCTVNNLICGHCIRKMIHTFMQFVFVTISAIALSVLIGGLERGHFWSYSPLPMHHLLSNGDGFISSFFVSSLVINGADGAVIGVDFGTENIVISTPAPGTSISGMDDRSKTVTSKSSQASRERSPLASGIFETVEVCLNEQSYRKTSNYIGFRDGERFFADEAKSLSTRFPDLMIPAVHRWVGITLGSQGVTEAFEKLYFNSHPMVSSAGNVRDETNNIQSSHNRSIIHFRFPKANNKVVYYTSDELLAMVFGSIVRIAEISTRYREPVKEAVVTVPHFFTDRQRQAIIDAAAVAGLRVISLMHPVTASALQYGIQNAGFQGQPKKVVILDVGAGSSHIGVYQYGDPNEKKSITSKKLASTSFGRLTTLALVSSSSLSGRSIDACIAKLMEDEAVASLLPTGTASNNSEAMNSKRVLHSRTVFQRKATNSLMRAANKVKEMLSANTVAPYTVEGFSQIEGDVESDGGIGKDYLSKMTRQFVLQNCVPSGEIIQLINKALHNANITNPLKQIDRFELIGGAPRIPQFLADIKNEIFDGKRSVDRTMNSDESAAVGAGYRAGILANVFRRGAVKGFDIQDKFALGHSLYVSAMDDAPSGDEGIAAPMHPLFIAAGDVTAIEALPNKGSPAALVKSLPFTRLVRLKRIDDFSLKFASKAINASVDDLVEDMAVRVTGVRNALEMVDYFSPFQHEQRELDKEREKQNKLDNLTKPDNKKKKSVLQVSGHEVIVEVTASESGIISVDSGRVVVKYYTNNSRWEKVKSPTKKKGNNNTNTRNEDMDKANDTDEPEQRFVSKITPHHRVFPLSISGLIAERSAKGEPNTNAPTSPTYYRQPLPMTLAEAQRSRGVLAQLDTIDEVKYKISVAKNDFEAYLIWAKTADIIDYMKEAMHYVTVVTARSLSSSDSISSDINEGSSPEVAMFDRSLEKYSDWLQTVSDDGVTAIQEEVGIDNTLVTASTYSTKLSELKAYVQRTAEGLEGRIMTIKEGVKKKEEGAMDSRLLAFSSSELKRKEPSILEQEEDLVSLD